MSENKFTDTLNQLLDQLETVKTEIEKQNARMKQLEASNKEMLAELESNMRFCRDRIYHGCDGCVLNEYCSLRKSIDRAKGLQQ